MRRSVVMQVLVLLAIVATIGVNAAANAVPINGLTTGDIADRFDVYFLPAAYVFSIWGLIYLGLVAYGVYQALPSQRDNPRLAAVDGPFLVASAANCGWIFAWHYEQFPLSLLVMLVLLASLLAIYLRLGSDRQQVPATEGWAVHIPFSIYLGWITVATVANVTALLDYLQWGGWGVSPEVWFIIVSLVVLAIAVGVLATRRDIAYGLVIPWAYVGIYARYPDVASVAVTSLLVAIIVLAVIVIVALRGIRRVPIGSPTA
jgi:hypothetical protein